MAKTGRILTGATSGAGAGAAFGPWGAVIGGGLGALGGMFGDDSDYQQRLAIDRALADIDRANWEAGDSAYGTDADYRDAMAGFRDRADDGMSVADRMAQEAAMNASARAARGRAGALRQEMASRGQAGGGAELAARLQDNQNVNEAQFGAGAQLAGEAQRRALEALSGWDTMAGTRAGAQDAIERFNASQRGAKARSLAAARFGQADVYGGRAAQDRRDVAGTGELLGQSTGDLFFGSKKKQGG